MHSTSGFPVQIGCAFLILFFLSTFPGEATAQSSPSLGEEGSVGAAVSVRTGATRLISRTEPIVAFAGVLRLAENWELGGEGVVAPRPIRVSADNSPDRSELALGYGGILVRYGSLPGEGEWGQRAAVQLGAGTARVRSPLAGAPVASSNFFLIEPQLELHGPGFRSIRPSVQLGYRLPLGVDPLPGVKRGQLRGPTLTVGLTLVRDP